MTIPAPPGGQDAQQAKADDRNNLEVLKQLLEVLNRLNSVEDSIPSVPRTEPRAAVPERTSAPVPNHPTQAELAQHHIHKVDEYPDWFECRLCQRAGQRKRFQLGDTLNAHIVGGQHQRELTRLAVPRSFSLRSSELDLPLEISRVQKDNANDFVCEVCNCGVISGLDSAVAHVRGVKHVKALMRSSQRPQAPSLGQRS